MPNVEKTLACQVQIMIPFIVSQSFLKKELLYSIFSLQLQSSVEDATYYYTVYDNIDE